MMYFGRRVWRGEAEGAFSEINAFSLEEADNSDMRSSIIICSVQTDLNDFSRNVSLLKRNKNIVCVEILEFCSLTDFT